MKAGSQGLTRLALSISGIYLIASSLWIFFSDRVAFAIATSPEMLALIQTWKGLWFVSVSALIIGLLNWIYGLRRAQAESRLDLVFEHISDAFVVVGHDWKIRYANSKVIEVSPFGKALIGMNLWEAYPEVIGTKFETAYRKAMSERVEVVTQDLLPGVEIWFEARGVPIPEGLAMFGRNITERRKAEIARKESEERFHIFLDNSPMAAWITDVEGKIQWASRGFRREMVSERDPVGLTIGDLFGPASERAIHGPIGIGMDVVEVGGPVVTVEHLPRPTGEAGHYLIHRFVLEGSQPGFGFVAVDITERIRSERMLQEVTGDDGGTAARLQDELDAFVHAISHDLRAPLRSLTGFTDALMDEYGGKFDADGARYLDYVNDAAVKMGRLIEGLLELSRVSRAEMTRSEVDLVPLIARRIERLRDGEPDRQVDVELPERLVVEGDHRLLKQAVDHLVDNAWKFTATQSPGRITLSSEEKGSGPIVVLSDNGVGFDMAHAQKLFTPFQRLHGVDEFDGVGIGLVVVQRIIRRHGGRVWLDAQPGGGTSVRFTVK